MTERDARQVLQASLAQRLGSSPVVVWRSTFTDGQYDGDIARIDLPAVDADRLADAWRCIEPSCRPAGADRAAQRRIVEEWARTVAVTAGRAGQGVDDELAIDTVVEALVRYPADCVLRALKNRRAAHKWRPTLSEILADVQWRARYREALRDAFVRAGVAAARREDDVDV